MSSWKSFGASVRGPAHIASDTPNQDAWTSFHEAWGDGIAVSDGLGSKPSAHFGSNAACAGAVRAAHACRHKIDFDQHSLSDLIKSDWLSLVLPRAPSECSATCLFAFRLGDGTIRLGMLGDGLAAAVRTDGSIVSLSEDKSQGFSNLTTPLSPNTSSEDWRHLSLPERECEAVLLCTDGVADDLEDAEGFVKAFIEAHRSLPAESAGQNIREMLEHWPTPKHSDDKTIACLCFMEVDDE